jgi:hypothetical protein
MGRGYRIVGMSRNGAWSRFLGENILVHPAREELQLDLRLHRKGALIALEDVVERVAGFANRLEGMGFETHGGFVVNRFDVALDLLFRDAELGRAALRAVSQLRWTKGRHWEWKREGHWGHVVGRGKRYVPHGNAYDKGVETGLAESGVWMRFEARKRFDDAESRPRLSLLTPAMMRHRFEDVFLNACPEGTKLDTRRYAVALAEMVEGGELTQRQYESLAGFLVAERAGTVDRIYSRSTAHRLAQEARSRGIPFQGSEPPEGFSLDVWAMLREFTVADSAEYDVDAS